VSAGAVGIAVTLFLRIDPFRLFVLSASTRALIAWDAATGLYLLLAWRLMLQSSVETMRKRAKLQDDGAAAVLGLTVAAACMSLGAIVSELIDVKDVPLGQHKLLRVALVGATLVLSWCLIHTAFAFHYAHEFYVDRDGGRGCLEFPGRAQPDYVDFLYFSFVIGTTSQTADVSISSPDVRRLALLHGVIAFFFNTTLLALTVNIAASQNY
jgi:uncharacterized membrane protein